MEILKIYDEVIIKGMKHQIREISNDCYFLHNYNHGNDTIFDVLNLRKNDFCKKILGYYGGGDFPFCKSLEDLTKLVNALKEVENKTNVELIYNCL